MTNKIHFDDGAAYERFMGIWSRLVGESFLDWLRPKSAKRWLDVGCGNGAFTEMIVKRCAPTAVSAIDPSDEQLAYARKQPAARIAEYRKGDAMCLPYPDDSFDIAVLPLVIFFVPDPAKGVAEMARVVVPGGTVAAYAWDMLGGGFPYDTLKAEILQSGVEIPVPPNVEASRIETMRDLWSRAGLNDIETREISVQRTFADFNDYWTTILGAPSVGSILSAMSIEDLELLKKRMRDHLSVDITDTITLSARANCVKGIVSI